jgi:hypothetical protein
MRAKFGIAAVVALTLCLSASAQTSLFAQFEWPATVANVIPDVRLNSVVTEAREQAREAEGRAREGRLYAGQASRREGARGFVGLKTQPVTIADGTVMVATPYAGQSGPALGVITYASGATMQGAFGGPNTGIFTAAPESMLAKFEGWAAFADSAHPQLTVGVFTFRNGDVFTGDWASGLGIYVEAGSARRFTGRIDTENGAFRPLAGVVQDNRNNLLAVVVR